MTSIPTINGVVEPDEDDRAYMAYLDEIFDGLPISYGLLLFKGDPIAFELGKNEWLAEEAA